MTTPTFTPLHPLFTGRYPVAKSVANRLTVNPAKSVYLVDLDAGICTCEWGAPFTEVTPGEYYPATYCTHKMKVLAKITRQHPDELMFPYTKALATRYNKYEVVSAFHKELRRGDYEKAVYWGMILICFRGIKGLIKYLINILYEETRDHQLGDYLLAKYKLALTGNLPIADVCICIGLFCTSIKKWETYDRLELFEDEMAGYKALATKYTYKVAQAKDIIPATEIPELTNTLLKGFASGNRVTVQIGIKGLFKSQSTIGHEKHKDYIFSLLEKIMNGRYPNKFAGAYYKKEQALQLHGYLMRRHATMKEHGYHELNAFCDFLTGETYGAGIRSTLAWNNALKQPTNIKIGEIKQIPLYAHDNHTWSGKAFLRKYAWQLGNQVDQTDIDFRWCGAYLGVAYRYQAFRQHKKIEVPWKDVKWSIPLHNIVMKMFY